MLTQSEKTNILSSFPNIKLSYENITHKKVYNSDIILAIPEGKKCFAWFTDYNDKNVCMIMELSEQKTQIVNITFVNACFSSKLVYGTILYGTLFYNSNNRFFSIEDVFYYKGSDFTRVKWIDKFSIIGNLLNYNIKQLSYNESFIVFGMPVFSNNYEDLLIKIQKLTYKISTIQFHQFNRMNNFLYMRYSICNNNNNNNNAFEKRFNYKTNNVSERVDIRNNYVSNKEINNVNHKYKTNDIVRTNIPEKNIYKMNEKREIIFQVKPDIQNDIYHLYLQNDKGTLIFYDIASIPDYKTSVMMNKLFRNIKENINLDALEESDDEEEFQNERADRFVTLDKTYNMICAYNYKFKKWYPLKVTDINAKISNHKDLQIDTKFIKK
uniref:mRNA capping enzyme adenylation domain-containing protein n=1 Tax=viral metagenome TaxID=1070528 RepID=A0A6C0ER34_9ZZZZ